jgi:hypothetical protein
MPVEKKIAITTVDADGVATTTEETPLAKKKASDLTGLSAKGIEELIRAKALTLRAVEPT